MMLRILHDSRDKVNASCPTYSCYFETLQGGRGEPLSRAGPADQYRPQIISFHKMLPGPNSEPYLWPNPTSSADYALTRMIADLNRARRVYYREDICGTSECHIRGDA